MTFINLQDELSKLGHILTLKEGVVFTLLMTGKGINKASMFLKVQGLVNDDASEKYPLIEAMNTTDEIFFIILKPKIS